MECLVRQNQGTTNQLMRMVRVAECYKTCSAIDLLRLLFWLVHLRNQPRMNRMSEMD